MAVAVAATQQDVYPPRVLVSVTGLTVGDAVELFRVVGGDRTPVRAGESASVTDTSFLTVDAELPFGLPVSYVAVVNGATEYTTSATTYTLDGGKPVLTDAIAGLAAEVVVMAWDEKRYNRQSSVFRVGGRQVMVSGDWGQFEGSIELFTETTSSRNNVMELLTDATEGVVQLRQPGGYDGVDAYLAVAGLSERRFSQDGSDQRRLIVADVVEVEGWAPALEARGFTYADLEAAYAPGPILNANPYFETDAANWTGQGGSVARSTVAAHEGIASLLFTPDGVTASVEARAELVPAQAGKTYYASAWVRCAAARDVVISLNWNGPAPTNTFLGAVNGPTVSLAANTWTFLQMTAVAPVGTGQVRLKPVLMGGTPPSSHVVNIDEALVREVPTYQDLANDYATYLALAQADLS